MSKYVLDASAVLALLNEEPGKDRVEAMLADSIVSSVNYCEVLTKLNDAGMTDKESADSFDLLNVSVIDFDRRMARSAAGLRPKTKTLGLSLGDRSCLALGIARKATVITADRAWSKLKIGAKIEVIR